MEFDVVRLEKDFAGSVKPIFKAFISASEFTEITEEMYLDLTVKMAKDLPTKVSVPVAIPADPPIFNGYAEADKIEGAIHKLLKDHPFSEANALQWLNMMRQITSGFTCLTAEIMNKFPPTPRDDVPKASLTESPKNTSPQVKDALKKTLSFKEALKLFQQENTYLEYVRNFTDFPNHPNGFWAMRTIKPHTNNTMFSITVHGRLAEGHALQLVDLGSTKPGPTNTNVLDGKECHNVYMHVPPNPPPESKENNLIVSPDKTHDLWVKSEDPCPDCELPLYELIANCADGFEYVSHQKCMDDKCFFYKEYKPTPPPHPSIDSEAFDGRGRG